MTGRATDEGTKTTWERQRFFMDMIAWGTVTDQTRLIFVGIEDGGKEWVRDRDFWKVDKKIQDCIDKADQSLVPNRYVVPSGESPSQQITEKFQCRFALELRRLLGIPPSPSYDAESYYRSTFLKQFELAANLHPFAKPTTASSLDERTRRYIGFDDPTSPLRTMSRKELIGYRLEGICRLRGKVASDHPLIVMVLMGTWTRPRYIRRQLIGEETNADRVEFHLPRRKQTATCIRKGRIVHCFIPHPSYDWISGEDATRLLSEMNEKKLFA